MRQIDEMTPQEIEVLHLKGMLGQRTVPADKPTAIRTSQPYTPEWDEKREHDNDLEHESREAEAQREMSETRRGEEKANQ